MRANIILVFAMVAGCSEGSGAVDAGQIRDLLGAAECASSGVTETQATRSTDAGSVKATAALLNALAHCTKSELSFKLVLDTHSVDLTNIDLVGVASIQTSDGAPITAGFSWAGGSESSHHRSGTLSVAAPQLGAAAWLRLTLRGIAGSDRGFEWDATVLAHDLP